MKLVRLNLTKAIMLLALLMLWPSHAFSATPGWLRVSFIEGDVQVKAPDSDEWGPASLNGPLSEGDQVWVPEGGLLELQMNTGTYVRLDQNSSLQILSLDDGSSQFYLSQGHAYVFYDAPQGNVIQIDTPSNSIRAYDNAVFRIDLSEGYTDVGVFDGYAVVESEAGNKRVNGGQLFSVSANGSELGRIGEGDDWENWNNERNARVAPQGEGVNYLPEEIKTYANDLDRNGRWVRSDEYGSVWVPSDVDRDWAPYSNGRWIWRGGEYIWVGFESWGWAPYHYGRWAFTDDLGWFWVPPSRGEVYWGPGYVGWVRTDQHVAWVPLAPRETYYGRGNYGRFSIDISNRRPEEFEPPHEYAHFHHPHGLMIVERNSFSTGRQVSVHVDINLFQRQAVERRGFAVGGPDIRPARGAYFAVERRISVEKAPPPRVREIRVIELKQQRPLVRESNRSVFKPGARAVELKVQVTAAPRRPHGDQPAGVRVLPAAVGDKDKAGPAGAMRHEGHVPDKAQGFDKGHPQFQNRTQAETPGAGTPKTPGGPIESGRGHSELTKRPGAPGADLGKGAEPGKSVDPNKTLGDKHGPDHMDKGPGDKSSSHGIHGAAPGEHPDAAKGHDAAKGFDAGKGHEVGKGPGSQGGGADRFAPGMDKREPDHGPKRFDAPSGPSGNGAPSGEHRLKPSDQGHHNAPAGGHDSPNAHGGPSGFSGGPMGGAGGEHRFRQDQGQGQHFAPPGGPDRSRHEGGPAADHGGGGSHGPSADHPFGQGAGHSQGQGHGQERKCTGPDGRPTDCPRH